MGQVDAEARWDGVRHVNDVTVVMLLDVIAGVVGLLVAVAIGSGW